MDTISQRSEMVRFVSCGIINMGKIAGSLDKIVEDCIRDHVGGPAFFEHLDEMVRDHTCISYIDALLRQAYLDDYENIIVSGKFGQHVGNLFSFKNGTNYIKAGIYYYDKMECLVVNGDLRGENAVITMDDKLADCCYGYDFAFVDDSFYSGKTRNVIKQFVEDHHGTLTQTYVVYDGSKEKDPTVKSLYRYYK